MEKPLPEKNKKKTTSRKLASIFLFIVEALRGVGSPLKWENLFLIFALSPPLHPLRFFYFPSVLNSKQKDSELLLLLHLTIVYMKKPRKKRLWSAFYHPRERRCLDKEKGKQLRAIKSKQSARDRNRAMRDGGCRNKTCCEKIFLEELSQIYCESLRFVWFYGSALWSGQQFLSDKCAEMLFN